MDFDKYKLFWPDYANVDYDLATRIIIDRAKKNKSFGVSALAVHGLMTSLTDESLGKVINNIDLIVPDGQPVRWALNSFYKLGMKDRVYGPELTLKVLSAANDNNLSVFLYGSNQITSDLFKSFIQSEFPNVKIVGQHIDRFREATSEEDKIDIERINSSKANIVFVGRGCPRQEFWVANHKGSVNAVMMAVGAAFDFHAGTLAQAPEWMQKNGLEWLYRLTKEPQRLWKRYLVTNTHFVLKFFKNKVILKRPY
ncbi:MAG: N-acetylglucosaminyldiphosphoundecaprenol N-acetyl-beta-D-mannosaminyltransferase [Roseivirga sp.]|jgi:N-acetylglucosaminyldiphosphoundecaprenol N-acetyl-beta-D-mannosaminyltransferase